MKIMLQGPTGASCGNGSLFRNAPLWLTFLLLLTLFAIAPTMAQAPAASDFQRVAVAEGLNLPMEFEISRDGRVFVIGKCGAIYAWQLDGGTPTQTSTLPNVRCVFEDGLLSLALDPEFTSNGYIYFQYTAPGSRTRVSRYKVNPDNSLDLASESILLEWLTGAEAHGHMGGSMLFDREGNLVITTGDNTAASGYFAPGAQATSGNTNDLRGKVLRIRPTATGGYTIPPGNLFQAGPLHRPEIYAMGFRNPFRINHDPLTGYLYLGDIGPDANAASAEGPMGMDELNEIREAGNYGWPYVLGINQPYAGFDPANLVNNHPLNTGATQLPPSKPALWTILHRAIMAGPVYRYDPAVDNEFKLPAYYDGKLIFWDFNSSRFFTIDLAAGNTPPIALDLPLNSHNVQGAIDAELDPRTHQLYVLQWGSGCCDQAPLGNGGLYRFDYIGGRDTGTNLALGATATATSAMGPYSAANAIDGNPETRWESAHADPQTLTIQLQDEALITAIRITWEAAYSSHYVIEGSIDGVTWELLAEENDGNGGVRIHLIEAERKYRYIRLTGTQRATTWGHSLYEFEIFGNTDSEPPELTEFAYLNMPRTLDPQFTGVPRQLSQTGAFSDTVNLVPNANLLPFSPNSALWSDRAGKARWISLPKDTRIGWHARDNWTFPEGTVVVKHFELPIDEANPTLTKRLETRLLVVKADGKVYGVTYRWRADNSDADLLTTGEQENISIRNASGSTWIQTWAYPSPTECIECHNANSAQILGVNTRQLNGNVQYPGLGSLNQLVHWNNLDRFNPGFSNSQVAGFDRTVAITDLSATPEQRVKSYLDTNCAHCHGTGNGGSQWDARFNTPLNLMRIVNQATTGIRNYANDYGIANAQVVTAGNPHESILYIRDKSIDPADRMPPLGRALEDTHYIQVLEQWINNLPSGPTNPGEPILLSLNKPVTTSSVQDDLVGANTVDGNPATRWGSDFSDPQWIQIDLGSVQPISSIRLHWEAAYASAYRIQGSVNGTDWSDIVTQNAGTGNLETFDSLSGTYRYIRLTGSARGTPWGYSLWEFEIWGGGSSQPEPEPVLLSRNKSVTTSAVEGGFIGANAVDGDRNSRWGSEHGDNHFIQIDLGEILTLQRIVLEWEAAHASAYVIEVSDNASSWTEIYRTTAGNGGTDDLAVNSQGRYVRLTGITRATPWGYSLYEFEVYGNPGGTGEPPVPQLGIVSPTNGHAFPAESNIPLQISVSDSNWFSGGGGYRYSLNSGAAITVAHGNPVNLGVLPAGNHTLAVTLLNVQGQPVGSTHTLTFSVRQPGGSNPDTPSPAKLAPIAALASSHMGGDVAANAIDGNPASRWESEHSDPQYIRLDMGQSVLFTQVRLHWEAAYGKAYTIDVSEDGSIWQTAYQTTTGRGGIEELALDGQRGRYIRMRGTERGIGYGYSLYEFDAYGIAADTNPALIGITVPGAGQVIPQSQGVQLQVDISDASWIANGGSYHYSLDGAPAVRINSLDAVNLGNLPTGEHRLRVSLLDSDGLEVSVPRLHNFRVLCDSNCPQVLVFSKTSGFRHGSIPAGIAMVEAIGAAHGYSVTASEDASLFTATNLAQYTTVVFMNTTGDIFTPAQKAAFQAYIESGGGYVGTHSAADTEHNWGWYINTLLGGARFIHHGDGIPRARVEIEQASHPLVSHIGSEWYLADEWYFWAQNPRGAGNVEVLANLDRSSYSSNYPVEDHPVIFTNRVGTGRAFYTAIGHVDENFSDPHMVETMRKAIEWTSAD
ncbi:discoidin domain-containing protein [Cellvibrio japonicus]|uniref:Carbohydrate binding protein, putative, cbp32B n=1 Tax=Cellvibrio japonicus (strain Ueda107) TaxID=498211 RepID=B3PLN7_CELJU|nr:discoidin domain-containing protein [Cellvibrio japonicus]ACE83872.1 carbohydrate binding protein, putative, cbp32B [Cellvibrio japonicus Ueda107]QEI13020.1 hypothetical protein FY117_12845 [Cellvibrio japonicus]QEI16594.1 hypothetical protein FY116_12850 [Cellvibrio japonicus]QEI20172.1 hypothetical protein FY115_12845 [Cellvibrio japonicus]